MFLAGGCFNLETITQQQVGEGVRLDWLGTSVFSKYSKITGYRLHLIFGFNLNFRPGVAHDFGM